MNKEIRSAGEKVVFYVGTILIPLIVGAALLYTLLSRL